MQKRIRHPLARLSQTSAASVYCKRPPRVWRAKGKLALTTVITTSIVTTRRRCSCSRGETTLRYTDVRTKQYSSVEAFSGDQTYKDKAFDVKLRLWEESYWMPQVSVGAKDIGGTGLFDAEYIVASKAWGRSTSRSVWDGAISAPAAT